MTPSLRLLQTCSIILLIVSVRVDGEHEGESEGVVVCVRYRSAEGNAEAVGGFSSSAAVVAVAAAPAAAAASLAPTRSALRRGVSGRRQRRQRLLHPRLHPLFPPHRVIPEATATVVAVLCCLPAYLSPSVCWFVFLPVLTDVMSKLLVLLWWVFLFVVSYCIVVVCYCI